MTLRHLLAASACAAVLFASTAPRAATIETSLSAWQAAAGAAVDSTTSFGLPLYSTVTSFSLHDGATLTLSGTADTVLQPLNGWGPWSGTYAGDIIDSTTGSETITFSKAISALGFELSPDVPIIGSDAETFTVTLSNGVSTTVSGNYPAGTTQFIGFTGGGVTSITISAANSPDFAFGNFVDVPEPISLALLATGLAAIGFVRRRA